MKILFLLFFICSVCYAGEVEIGRTSENNPIIIVYDDKYSFKNFSNPPISFSDGEIDGKVIYSSSFYREEPDTKIFSDKMHGTTFVKCNLNNIIIPEGNIIIDCSQKRFKVQNDLRDWYIDKNNIPIEICDKEYWIKNNFSINPSDIPSKRIEKIDNIKKIYYE